MHDTPEGHVTRDYKEGLARLSDLRFKVVDTSGMAVTNAPSAPGNQHVVAQKADVPSGLEPNAQPGTIQARTAALTEGVLNGSTIALFMLDARYTSIVGYHTSLHCNVIMQCWTRLHA